MGEVSGRMRGGRGEGLVCRRDDNGAPSSREVRIRLALLISATCVCVCVCVCGAGG